MASTDPVALDYWAAKHILLQTASLIGYTDTHTLDPDNTEKSAVSGEAFGVWLSLAKDEILAGGYNVTTDENQMNVYVESEGVPPEIGVPSQNPTRDNVGAGEKVRVSVNVTDVEDGVKNATLFYTINNENAWENRTMNYNVSTGLYEATIPGQVAGAWVKFKIVAYDNAGNDAAIDGTEPYCTYQVIPEFQSFLIPLLFMISTILAVMLHKKTRSTSKTQDCDIERGDCAPRANHCSP
jgi:hypothetical protein